MRTTIVGPLSILHHDIRAVVIASISFALFLFAGCESNAPTSESDQNTISGSEVLKKGLSKSATQSAAAVSASSIPLGSASAFTVLGATTVTNAGASLITGNLGVSPGSAITGFQPIPLNTISGPGTVTAGLGIVTGTIYAGGPVAAQAHNDAVLAYNFLIAQVPDTIYAGVTQLDGLTLTPGVYNFAPSANLQVNGNLYLDFQGDSNAVFIFQTGSTLVTMAGSNVIALNNNTQTCSGKNVYWAVGSSATIDGAQFVGSVIATTTITMTSGANVSGRIFALNGAVTMIEDTISVCRASIGNDSIPTSPCKDFVTGGGWIKGNCDSRNHKHCNNDKATFGVSGGIKNDKFWGQLSYNDHCDKYGIEVKSRSVTGYIVIDEVTRQIDGVAKINGRGSFTYTVIVVDNSKSGRTDSFSIKLSNGYSASGTLKGGNITLHQKCGGSHDCNHKEDFDDKDEKDGRNNCDDNNHR